MTRLEKIQLAIQKGFTCNPKTGEVFTPKGEVVKGKSNTGYGRIQLQHNKKSYHLRISHFIYFMAYNELPQMIDHIDRNRSNDCISNLRSCDYKINNQNKIGKGYYYNKIAKRYQSYIYCDKKPIHLGLFDTEQEARQSYLDAKKIYHI